jgi:hypothetical protein
MRYLKYYYQSSISLCITLIVIIFYHFLSHSTLAPIVVTVNITEITQPWILEIAALNLTEEENIEEFSKRIEIMDKILREVSSKYHWLVISSQTVLAGAEDITPFISAEINSKLEPK